MSDLDILKDKKILIVDDEPDILETLEELLDMCIIDSAPDYETAAKFLKKNIYDVAVLDIMGVSGYDLLQQARERGIPALMLTAHALSPENLKKSVESGAHAYVPKDKITDIADFVAGIIKANEEKNPGGNKWFSRLKPFFDSKFGKNWRKKDEAFWREFDSRNVVTKDDVNDIM